MIRLTKTKDYDVILQLINKKLQAVYKSETILPVNQIDCLKEALLNILKNHYGLIDVSKKTFLLAYKVEDLFYNKKGLYTPEWGHNLEDQSLALDFLTRLYEMMNKKSYVQHALSDFTIRGLDSFMFNNSYGSRCMDGHTMSQEKEVSNHIRRADPSDFDTLLSLFEEHQDDMNKPPALLGFDKKDPKEVIDQWFRDEDEILLYKDQAMMRITEGSSGGCLLGSNHETLGISTTQVSRNHRREGLASHLINYTLNQAFIRGFKHVTVDYETCNPGAHYLWTRYFKETIRSYLRFIT